MYWLRDNTYESFFRVETRVRPIRSRDSLYDENTICVQLNNNYYILYNNVNRFCYLMMIKINLRLRR